MTRFVVVEDDEMQVDYIKELLSGEYPEALIEEIHTEHEFYEAITGWVANPPDMIIMDVMVPWTEPSPNMPRPPRDVEAEGFYRAGLRCQARLRSTPELTTVPIILYTVLDEKDLERELSILSHKVVHVVKDSDGRALLQQVAALLTR